MTEALLRALAAIAVIGAASPALAQAPDSADEVFAAAMRAYAAGYFQQAATLFARASELGPTSNKKFNEAQAWRRAGDRPRAADAYAEALRLGQLDASAAETCRRKLAELRSELGLVLVDAPEGTRVRVAHVDGAVRQVHLPPGPHRIELAGPGGQPTSQRAVTIIAGQVERVALSPSVEARPSASPAPAKPRDTTTPTRRVVGWSLVGVAGAGGIAAVVLGARFLSVLGDYEDDGYWKDSGLEDEALRLRTITNVVAFTSVAVGGLGLVLVFTSPDPPPRRPALTLGPARAGAGAELRGRW